MDKIQEGREKEEEKGGYRQDDKSRPKARRDCRKRNIMRTVEVIDKRQGHEAQILAEVKKLKSERRKRYKNTIKKWTKYEGFTWL